MSRLNREFYQKLIDEDVEWLRTNAPDTLERRHVEIVLDASVTSEYDGTPAHQHAVIERDAALAELRAIAKMPHHIGTIAKDALARVEQMAIAHSLARRSED